jgi:hypothetical protein
MLEIPDTRIAMLSLFTSCFRLRPKISRREYPNSASNPRSIRKEKVKSYALGARVGIPGYLLGPPTSTNMGSRNTESVKSVDRGYVVHFILGEETSSQSDYQRHFHMHSSQVERSPYLKTLLTPRAERTTGIVLRISKMNPHIFRYYWWWLKYGHVPLPDRKITGKRTNKDSEQTENQTIDCEEETNDESWSDSNIEILDPAPQTDLSWMDCIPLLNAHVLGTLWHDGDFQDDIIDLLSEYLDKDQEPDFDLLDDVYQEHKASPILKRFLLDRMLAGSRSEMEILGMFIERIFTGRSERAEVGATNDSVPWTHPCEYHSHGTDTDCAARKIRRKDLAQVEVIGEKSDIGSEEVFESHNDGKKDACPKGHIVEREVAEKEYGWTRGEDASVHSWSDKIPVNSHPSNRTSSSKSNYTRVQNRQSLIGVSNQARLPAVVSSDSERTNSVKSITSSLTSAGSLKSLHTKDDGTVRSVPMSLASRKAISIPTSRSTKGSQSIASSTDPPPEARLERLESPKGESIPPIPPQRPGVRFSSMHSPVSRSSTRSKPSSRRTSRSSVPSYENWYSRYSMVGDVTPTRRVSIQSVSPVSPSSGEVPSAMYAILDTVAEETSCMPERELRTQSCRELGLNDIAGQVEKELVGGKSFVALSTIAGRNLKCDAEVKEDRGDAAERLTTNVSQRAPSNEVQRISLSTRLSECHSKLRSVMLLEFCGGKVGRLRCAASLRLRWVAGPATTQLQQGISVGYG